MLLGFVAEGLIKAGKRILILAPTHQGVNNALSTIKNFFPNRPVIKVGDDLRTESLNPGIPIISSNVALKEVSADTVVGMTFLAALNRLMLGDQRPFSPNVVIIDEAGQLPLTQGTCTALCGAGTILFFGDDRQMPPVFSGEISDDDLAVSVFAQLRKTHPDLINMLSITHRLNQELCQHISNSFYADSPEPLHSSNLARVRCLEIKGLSKIKDKSIKRILGPTNSLVWVKIVTDKYMQSNEPEASMVARLIETCLKSGMQPAEIAVVTPFRRQARLIYNILNNIYGNIAQLPIVDTVERVQGATVDLVIFSFCASQPDYVGSLSNFLFSPNRLNVALSRARRKSIFLSSPNIFNVIPLEHQGIVGRNTCRKLLENVDDSFFL
jgi:superfamily I DNA and/or RNA helicase